MAISSGVSLTDEYLFCISYAATHKCIIVNHSKIFIINIVSVHHSLTTALLWGITVAESTHKRHLFFPPKVLMSAVWRNNKYNTARRLLTKITAPQTRR